MLCCVPPASLVPVEERNARIYREYLEGARISALAKRYGISPARVYQIVQKKMRRDIPANFDVKSQEFRKLVRRCAWEADVPFWDAYRFLRIFLREVKRGEACAGAQAAGDAG